MNTIPSFAPAADQSPNLHVLEYVEEAASVVRETFGARPDAAIVLGTGLGQLAAEINDAVAIEYASIPGFPLSTVESHAGRLLCGTLGGKTVVAMFLRGEALVITVDGESHEVAVEDLTIVRRASGSLVVEEDGGFFAAIDPTVTPELRMEGYARELISRVQRMRKEAGLAVSDRIVLAVEGTPDMRAVIESHGDWIAAEVLAAELVVRDDLSSAEEDMHVVDLGATTARVAITRIG